MLLPMRTFFSDFPFLTARTNQQSDFFGRLPKQFFQGVLVDDDALKENLNEAGEYVVTFGLPGYNASQVTIDVTEHSIEIAAKCNVRGIVHRNYSLSRLGKFDVKRATATMKDGLLTLTIPQRTSTSKEKIEVKEG